MLYTVLGCLVESLGMIVVTVPLLYPVLLQYGIDPIWFGVILVLFIEMGQISPPIGINLFVIQSIWTGKLSDVVDGHDSVSSDHVRPARLAGGFSRDCDVAAVTRCRRSIGVLPMFAAPPLIETEVFARLPDKFRRKDP